MEVAPSEEFVLHCDVPSCHGQLSMVSGVSRDQHGWGRASIDGSTTADYDLCPEHWRRLKAVLGVIDHD